MKIKFQKEDFNINQEITNFTSKNSYSGSTMSFLGKVKQKNRGKKVRSIDIEFYEKMAFYQTKLIIKKIKRIVKIIDCLIIHRYGKLLPGENIVLVLVCSEHRNQSFFFLENIINHLKLTITFWKKENYGNSSKWVQAELNESNKLE